LGRVERDQGGRLRTRRDARFLHVDMSMSDGTADESRYPKSRWSSRPSMMGIKPSSSPSLFSGYVSASATFSEPWCEGIELLLQAHQGASEKELNSPRMPMERDAQILPASRTTTRHETRRPVARQGSRDPSVTSVDIGVGDCRCRVTFVSPVAARLLVGTTSEVEGSDGRSLKGSRGNCYPDVHEHSLTGREVPPISVS